MKTLGIYETRIVRRVSVGESLHGYDPRRSVISPDIAAELIRAVTGGPQSIRESVGAVLLDVRNRPLGASVVAMGGPAMCPVDIGQIFREAVSIGASQILLGHNHPSGNTSPSQEDCTLTRRAVEAGHLLGISVVDHVVVGPFDFTSIRQGAPYLFE